MKKIDIVKLVQYHVSGDDAAFRRVASEIADSFNESGDLDVSEQIYSLVNGMNIFMPQSFGGNDSLPFCEVVTSSKANLFLPDVILSDIADVVRAIKRGLGFNRILFQGRPGTGKTEAAKQVARLSGRTLYVVNFSMLIDSRLGQTQKNIAKLFDDLNHLNAPEQAIVLFDEIDAIALDRINSSDVREMGRVTSSFLRELDHLSDDVVIIATTNLFGEFDRALVRRFDIVVDFNRYSKDDIVEIASHTIDKLMKAAPYTKKDVRLMRKILDLMNPYPSPSEIVNMVRTSILLSEEGNEKDYLRRMFASVTKGRTFSMDELYSSGFTFREMEVLTGISKSTISRTLKTAAENE